MLGEIAAPLVPEFAGLLVALTLIAATLVAIGIITVLNAFARAVVGGMAALLGGALDGLRVRQGRGIPGRPAGPLPA
jgi:branched-subunit amino acid ABC-type transport system permease component